MCSSISWFMASPVAPISIVIDWLLIAPVKARHDFKNQRLPPRAALLTGAALLNANASSFGFMVLVTDGEHTSGFGDPVTTAEGIRADNKTTIFAVGVGRYCVREGGCFYLFFRALRILCLVTKRL